MLQQCLKVSDILDVEEHLELNQWGCTSGGHIIEVHLMISSIWDSFWSHNEGVEPTPLKILPFPGQEGRLRSGHMGIRSGGLLRFGFPQHYWGSSKLREAKSKSPLNSIKPLFFEMVAKAQWIYSLKFSRRADYFMTVVSWCNILNQISVLVKHSEVWLVIVLKKGDFSVGFKPCWNVMVVVLSVLFSLPLSKGSLPF